MLLYQMVKGRKRGQLVRSEDVVHDGHVLKLKNTAKDGTKLFYCAFRERADCPAAIRKSPTGQFTVSTDHSHLPVPQLAEVFSIHFLG